MSLFNACHFVLDVLFIHLFYIIDRKGKGKRERSFISTDYLYLFACFSSSA